MTKPVPHLDHVVINVNDGLDDAHQHYQRLGFQLTPRGHHSLGSSNHLAIFGDNYLELLGYEEGKAQTRTDVWQSPLGLSGLVWKTQSADDVYQHLQQQQIDGTPPKSFYRPVTLPDGSEPQVKFRVVPLASERVPNGRSFFCQHLTPEHVWRDEWQQHPNQVTSIVEFVIAAEQPQQAAAVYGELFGADTLRQQEDEVQLTAGAATVRFIKWPQACQSFYAKALDESGTARMVALGLATRSLDAVRQQLIKGDITFIEQDNQILVSAAEARGVALAFYQQ